MYYTKYTGSESVSIVNALAEIGENGSYANRKLIAAANGIADYSGTATQNLLLLSLLKDGKLIKPGTDAPAQPENTAEPTKQGFGRKVLIGALVLGAGIAAYIMFGNDEPKTATKKSAKKSTKKSAKKNSRKGLKGIENDEQRAISYLKANYHGKHAEDIEEYVGNNWDWDKTNQENLESFEAWLDNDNVLFLQDRFPDNSDEIDEFIDAEWDDTKSRYVNLKAFKEWLDDRNHNYNEGGDLFEVSGINDGKGTVKPLYNVDDYYGDDYVFAEQWLKEKLAADGLKIDKFWINEADGCWEFISKPNRK